MGVQIIGIAAGVFTGISLLPQLIKLVKEKKSQDISIIMLVFLLIGLILWVIYGIKKDDWPIMTTNAFSLVVNCCVIGLNQYYKARN